MMPISNCRSCDSTKLTLMLDLGEQYISDFREDDSKPPKYPLEAVVCKNCMLVQLRHSVPQSEMYHENYGFKSGVSDSIKADLKDIVFHAQQFKDSPKSWLDIACNDGTLLSFVPEDSLKVGVDPVGFLCKEAEAYADQVINGFFSADDFFCTDYDLGGSSINHQQFDIITSISCFYDMPDPNMFVSDVKKCMVDDGIWIIQQNYLLTTLELGAVDNFCHEHLEYYTLLSLEKLLERHGLEVIDLVVTTVNGGSLRTVVAKKGVYPIQDSVERQRAIELDAKLSTLKPYLEFVKNAMLNLRQFHDVIRHFAQEGNSIYILAASTRGSTLWQSAGVSDFVAFAVERNPAKVGKWFSAIGIPIISEEEARKRKPDYMIIGPWFFADEIIEREKQYLKEGGKLILPLPKLEIINGSD